MKRFPFKLSRIWPRRIWSQCLAVLISLVIIPLIFFSFLLLNSSQIVIQETILRDYQEIARHASGEINAHLQGMIRSMAVTAAILGTLHADQWRQETAVVELALRSPLWQRMAVLNLEGQEIAVSELGTPLKKRVHEKGFKEAREGKQHISSVENSKSQGPSLTVAMPIIHYDKVEGVLIGNISLKNLWKLMTETDIGEKGEAFIIDENAKIIAPEEQVAALKNEITNVEEIFSEIKPDQAGRSEIISNNNQDVVLAYAPLKNTGWGLVLIKDKEEAYASLYWMKLQFSFIICASVLCVIAVGIFAARRLSQPLNRLIDGTQKISRGDFSQHFPVKRRDEIGRLFFSFNQMTRRLRAAQKVERLSTIRKSAAAIAHELKNSLVLVNTFIELLPKRHKDQKFIKEFFQTVPQELESWNTMLKNMMNITPLALENMPLQELKINDILQVIFTLVQHRIQQKEIELRVSLDAENPVILGNEEKIKQALLNIVTNSIDATPKGGRIEIETRIIWQFHPKMESKVEVTLSNSGNTIEEEQLDKIFDPFFTTKAGGVGLGLSISKEIINAHRGDITVINRATEGVIFTVILPALITPKSVG